MNTNYPPQKYGLSSTSVVWVLVMVIFWWLFLFSSIEATLIGEQQ